LNALASSNEGKVAVQPTRLPAEEYGQSIFDLRPSRAEHTGIVEDFSIIVLLEFAQFCLDIWYLGLFTFCFIMPHRGIAVTLCLVEPKVRWPARVGGKVLRLLKNLEDDRMDHLARLSPVTNEYAKRGLSTSQFNQSVAKLEKKMKLHHTMRNGVLKVLRSTEGLGDVHDQIQHYFHLKDSYLMLMSMKTVSNQIYACPSESVDRQRLITTRVHLQEDSFCMVIDELNNQEDALRLKTTRIEMDIKTRIAALESEAFAVRKVKKWGPWHKPTDRKRTIIKNIAKSAAIDLAMVCLTFFILGTFVRLVPLVRDLQNSGSFLIIRHKPRMILIRHGKGVVADIIMFVKTLLLVLGVCLTGVAVPGFIAELPLCQNLKMVCKAAQRHISKACEYFCELLSLVLVWDTYKLLVRASLFSFLVPAACVGEAFHGTAIGAGMKFRVSILIWVAFFATGVWVSQIDNDDFSDAETDFSVALLVVLGMLIGLLLLTVVRLGSVEAFTTLSESDTVVRLTWPNILAHITIWLESAQLSSLTYVLYASGGSISSVFMEDMGTYMLGLGVKENEFRAVIWLAIACAMVWVLIISLPLCEGGEAITEKIKQNAFFHNCAHLFGTVFFVFTTTTLLRPFACMEIFTAPDEIGDDAVSSADGISCDSDMIALLRSLSLPFLLHFVITSQLLSSESGLRAQTNDSGLDLRFSPLFAMGSQLLSFLFIVVALAAPGRNEDALLVLVCLSALRVIWILLYSRLYNTTSNVGYAPILHATSTLSVCWVVTTLYLQTAHSQLGVNGNYVEYGWAGLLVAGAAAALVKHAFDQRRRFREWKSSGIKSLLEEIINIQGKLCASDLPMLGEWFTKSEGQEKWELKFQGSSTPKGLASCILHFESFILAERLTPEFTRQRAAWKRSMNDYVQGTVVDGRSSNDLIIQTAVGQGQYAQGSSPSSPSSFTAEQSLQEKNMAHTSMPILTALVIQLKCGIRTTTPLQFALKALYVACKKNRVPWWLRKEVVSFIFDYKEFKGGMQPICKCLETRNIQRATRSISNQMNDADLIMREVCSTLNEAGGGDSSSSTAAVPLESWSRTLSF
jgi:hypothetical protein